MSESRPADDVSGLLKQIRAGDATALDRLLASHRDAVRRFLELRMDPRLRARVDVSDVIQEAHLEVARRMEDFLAREPMAFRVWLLKTAHQQLLRLRRMHVEAACRSAGKEVGMPEHASVVLADRLAAAAGTASQQLTRAELVRQVQAALDGLSEVDREVILLRTVEGLSNQEAAEVLEIDPDAASKRYTRALTRLRLVVGGGGK